MTGDAVAAGEPEIAVEVAYPDRIAPGDGREEHLQPGIGQRSFFFLQRHGQHSFGLACASALRCAGVRFFGNLLRRPSTMFCSSVPHFCSGVLQLNV